MQFVLKESSSFLNLKQIFFEDVIWLPSYETDCIITQDTLSVKRDDILLFSMVSSILQSTTAYFSAS